MNNKLIIFFLILVHIVFTIKSESYITEIINNTDTSIRIRWSSIKAHVILASDSIIGEAGPIVYGKVTLPSFDKLTQQCIILNPKTRYLIYNLIIPEMGPNSDESVIPYKEKQGLVFHLDKYNTVSYANANTFFATSMPFLILGQRGDFLSYASFCGSIKNFNFFGQNMKKPLHNQMIEGIVNQFIPNESTYSIEINQIQAPVVVRSSCYAYITDSINFVFKKNNIDANMIKSKLLNEVPPVAYISSFTSENGPTNVTISFDKNVTNVFVTQFFEYLMSTKFGKFFSFDFTNLNKSQSYLNFVIYTKITQEELQNIINQVNKKRFHLYI